MTVSTKESKTRTLIQGNKWLCKQLGISQGTLQKYFADPTWDWGKSPFNLEQIPSIQAWIVGRRSTNAGGRPKKTNPVLKQREKLLSEQAREKKRENDEAEGKLISREEFDNIAIARVLSVKAKLLELPLRASLIANKSEIECETILKSWAKEICDYYAGNGK